MEYNRNNRLFYIKRTKKRNRVNEKSERDWRMAKVIVKLKPQGEIPPSHRRIEIKFHYFSNPKDLKMNKK